MSGTDLLSSFRTSRSDDTFAELVQRYTNLVYSAAHRRLPNPALAEEATQLVFIRLAKAVPKLNGEACLVAWLHRTTVHVAIDLCRSEMRRHAREQIAATMKDTLTEPEEAPLWTEITPHLDEALDLLKEEDRQAILLRFYAQKRMSEVGQSLGVSEDAAKMRVNRALDRLRSQLALRGVTCSVAVLATLMTERLIEAAPAHLVSGLKALHVSAPSGGGESSLLASKTKLSLVAVGILGVALSLMLFLHPPKAQNDQVADTSNLVEKARARPPIAKRTIPLSTRSNGSAAEQNRLALQVIDAETSQPLPETKVNAVYFYAGGVPEGHLLRTDASGKVAIPEPDGLDDKGMNVFISAEFHVPICLSWSERMPTNRIIRLDPALTIAGTVKDEQGQPVAGVKVEVRGPGIDGKGPEHVAFNGGNTAVTTDANGQWRCPYIPKSYDSAKLILTADGYAVTLADVPVGTAESTNAKLVIKSGYAVAGRVVDAEDHPVLGARVKELHNWGYRRQATETDHEGRYVLHGLWDPLGKSEVVLVVQANGLAPQAQTIHLLTPTNRVDFTLAKGRLFRGRITDGAGNPIPNATIRTDSDNQGLRKFEWHSLSDGEGRFVWDAAPEEPVLFWFEASGFQVIRDLSLVADGSEHVITLKH